MSGRGLFIALEGGEGAGKTTQSTLLSSWFTELGLPHVATREPGGTGVGEAVRSIVLARDDLTMPGESELFLLLAARAAFVSEVVRPALEAGRLVLADRFNLSTLAYQGFGRGLDLGQVRRALAFATGGLEPDLHVLLEVPAELGASRQRAGGKRHDRIEREGPDFMVRVREGYLALADGHPTVRVVPGLGAPEEVHMSIRRLLCETFPETFPSGGV